MPLPDLDAIRARFPALAGETVFLENAGGSQVPRDVADAMHRYLTESYVQLGAGYPLSDTCTETVARAHDFANVLMNGEESGVAILGSSCTQLVQMLARARGETIRPGDEIVVMESGHEANVGPWIELAERGAVIRTWRFDADAMECPLDALADLVTDRTRIVAVVHVSNLLGGILDLRAVVDRAHAVGARVVVDGVAYAPHRAIDVEATGVDYYVYSTYKVYGPHMGAMYARREALAGIDGPNHFFVPEDDLPYRFEPGGVSHEGAAGILALGDYLAFLAGAPAGTRADRALVERAFDRMAELEAPLTARLVGWLADHPRFRVIGPESAGAGRVPTVSFVHDTLPAREVTRRLHAAGIAMRHGHMYAYRLMEPLGLDPEDGVVRISAVHYNTPAEIERTLETLEEIAQAGHFRTLPDN